MKNQFKIQLLAVLVLVAGFGLSGHAVTFTNQTGIDGYYDSGGWYGVPLPNGASVTFQPGEEWVVGVYGGGLALDLNSWSGTVYSYEDAVTLQPDGSLVVNGPGSGGGGGGDTGGGGSSSSAPLDLAAVASNIVGWLGLAAAAGVVLFAAIYVLRVLIRSFQALK